MMAALAVTTPADEHRFMDHGRTQNDTEKQSIPCPSVVEKDP